MTTLPSSRKTTPLWLLLAITPLLAQAQTHLFTGVDGQSIAANIVAVKDVDVVVKSPAGKAFVLDIASMNPTDRAYVQQWKASANPVQAISANTESEIEVSVALEPAVVDGKTAAPGTFTPTVSLHNRESQASFKGLKGTLVLVGQAANNPGKFKVLAVEKFTATMATGETYAFTGKACAESSAQGNQPAYHYRGYFFILQNAEDNVIQFHRVGPFIKTSAEVLKYREGTLFLWRVPVGYLRPRATATSRWRGSWEPMTSTLPLHVTPTPQATTTKLN